MAYTDVISLEDAKEYLGVDDDSRDTEIYRMISAALRFVEQHTGHIVDARNKKYYYRDRQVDVYDFPINSVVSPDPNTTTATVYANKTNYVDSDADSEFVELNVGYTDVLDIPPVLVEAAYMLLDHFFNQGQTGSIPQAAWQLIQTDKRHLF